MSYSRKSLAPYTFGQGVPEKTTVVSSATRSKGTTVAPLASRKSFATSRIPMMQSQVDLRQYEARILASASTVIPQFLISTRFSGVIPQPFSSKNLRRDEFLSIYSHIMRQIDPSWKFGPSWEIDFEFIAKTYGYPFSVPSKSSMASFDVSEATRRCVVLNMTWLVQFILYFNDVYGMDGVYRYQNTLTNNTQDDSNDDLDNITTFLLVRKSYHQWLKTGNDNVIAQDLIETSINRQAEIETEIKSIKKESAELQTAVTQFNNVHDEISAVQARINALQNEIQREDNYIADLESKNTRLVQKITDKQLVVGSKNEDIAKSQQLIANITQLLTRQSQTEDDVKNIRKTQLVLQKQYDEYVKNSSVVQNEIEALQDGLRESLTTLQDKIQQFNSICYQINHQLCVIEDSDGDTNGQDGSARKTTSLKLCELQSLSDSEIAQYILIYSKQHQSNQIHGKNDEIIAIDCDTVDLKNLTTKQRDQSRFQLFKPTQQFIQHQDPTLPHVLKSTPVDTLTTLSQQCYQQKRLLSTNLLSTTQDIGNIERDIAHIQTLLQQSITQIEWLRQTAEQTSAKIASKASQHDDLVHEYDAQYDTLQHDIVQLQQSEKKLAKLSEKLHQLRNEHDSIKKDQSREEYQYAQTISKFCGDIREHLHRTNHVMNDCYTKAVSTKQKIHSICSKHPDIHSSSSSSSQSNNVQIYQQDNRQTQSLAQMMSNSTSNTAPNTQYHHSHSNNNNNQQHNPDGLVYDQYDSIPQYAHPHPPHPEEDNIVVSQTIRGQTNSTNSLAQTQQFTKQTLYASQHQYQQRQAQQPYQQQVPPSPSMHQTVNMRGDHQSQQSQQYSQQSSQSTNRRTLW